MIRVLTIEDTLELPGDCLRATGYKVQTMLVDERIQGTATTRADDALRVSLRLGELPAGMRVFRLLRADPDCSVVL